MGFHIQDSPRASHQRDVHDAAADMRRQASASMSTQTAEAPSFAPNFSAAARRRRNALVPVLTLDVVGSPRSPYVCLTHNHRRELMQRFDRQQEQHTHTQAQTVASSNSPSIDKQTIRRPHPTTHSAPFFTQP